MRLWLGILILSLASFSLIWIGMDVNKEEPSPAAPRAEISSAATGAAPQEGYTVRTLDGRLAVYKAGEDVPMEVLDFDVRVLPDPDQADLEKGIYLPDKKSLLALLEDFTG